MVQEPNDLRFQVHPQAKFDVRAAVLLVHAGQLLATVNSASGIALVPSGIALVPGGAVKFGETAAEAAAREIHEELKLNVVPQLVGIVESFWQQPERTYQQLIMVHRVTLTDAQKAGLVWQEGLEGEWLPFAKAARVLQPRSLAQFLTSGDAIRHLVDHHTE
ncbi:NUDIX domain-containing protein [Lacticaseibacillus paracasei]|nr:NUDIX domain-containing protein [Lacticaseibacillus paracasei]